MSVFHKDLQDPEIHEPKGVSTALPGQVYVANGSGTGVWKNMQIADMQGNLISGGANDGLALDGSGGIKPFKRLSAAQAGWTVSALRASVTGTVTPRSRAIAYNSNIEGTGFRVVYEGIYRVKYVVSLKGAGSMEGPQPWTVSLRLVAGGGSILGPWETMTSGAGAMRSSNDAAYPIVREHVVEGFMALGNNDFVELRNCDANGNLLNPTNAVAFFNAATVVKYHGTIEGVTLGWRP